MIIMENLTPFERVKNAIEHKKTDRVPVVPQITYTTYQLTGISMLEAMKEPEKMSDALVAGYREIGYDGIYSGWESSFNIMAEAMGCEMRYPEDDVPSVSGGIIKSVEDIEKVKIPDPYTEHKLSLHLETLRLVRKKAGKDVPIFNYIPGPLTVAGLLMDTDKLMLNIIKKPDLVHSVCKIAMEAGKIYGKAKLECGGDIMVIGDPTASCSLISPKMFEKFAFPYLKEMCEYILELGGIPSIHICGNTTPILEKIADTGTKIIEIDHMVNLKDAINRIGNRICIQGNVDPAKFLMEKPEKITELSKKCLEESEEREGYILSTGCEIPLKAPIENVKAMVKAVKSEK
jgi:uroporphyrinogen decarboxylase